MLKLYRLAFAFVLMGFVAVAHAAFPPSTMYTFGGNNPQGQPNPWRSTQAAACADGGTAFTWNESAKTCSSPHWSGSTYFHTLTASGARCPLNSTLTNGQCVCAANYVDGPDGNSCVQEDPCSKTNPWGQTLDQYCASVDKSKFQFSAAGKNTGMTAVCQTPQTQYFGAGDGPSGFADQFPGCNRGCMGMVNGDAWAASDDQGNWTTQGTAQYAGSSCDPAVIANLNTEPEQGTGPDTPETSKAPDPTCNGYKGQVNGVSTCVPYKASSGIDYVETQQNSDGTTTETKQTTECTDGKCTTTKETVNKDSAGNTTSSSSVSTDQSMNQYCTKNPAAGQCKANNDGSGEGEGEEEKGSFGGSCSAGWQCKGDPLQCALAKEQHKRNCETLEPDTDQQSAGNKAVSGTDAQSAEALKGEAESLNVASSLNEDGFGWGRSCPPDPQIALPWVDKTLTIEFSRLCGILSVLSSVAVGITMLGLFFWLVGGRKSGGEA